MTMDRYVQVNTPHFFIFLKQVISDPSLATLAKTLYVHEGSFKRLFWDIERGELAGFILLEKTAVC